jgi:hypothetical protein
LADFFILSFLNYYRYIICSFLSQQHNSHISLASWAEFRSRLPVCQRVTEMDECAAQNENGNWKDDADDDNETEKWRNSWCPSRLCFATSWATRSKGT